MYYYLYIVHENFHQSLEQRHGKAERINEVALG